MTDMMGFSPLDEELEIFFSFSGKKSVNDEITWNEIVNILNEVKIYLNERAKKAVNYTSYGDYTFDCYHHRNRASKPNIPYKSPASMGMDYGFEDFRNCEDIKVNNVHKPLIKCPETLYAESKIKLGDWAK